MINSQHTLSPGNLDTSLRNSTIAGAIGMFFFMTIQNGPIPLMLEKLGAGGIAIGLTTTLFQLGMIIQVPATFYTERLIRRKTFFSITHGLARSFLAIPGIYMLTAEESLSPAILLTLAAIGLFGIVAQSSSPIWFSWMADLVPSDRSSSFWAQRQGWVMVTSLTTVAVTGWFLDLFPEQSLDGFAWILIIASVFGIMDIVIHWFVFEPEPQPVNRSLSAFKRIFQPLENPDFRYFTLAMCVWFFGLGFFAPFMNVYLKTEFALTYTHLSSIQMAGMLSGVVASFVSGHLISRMGLRTYGLAMVLTVPLFSIAWFILNNQSDGLLPILGKVPQPVVVLCCSSIIAGGVYAAVGLLQFNLLGALSPAKGRTMAMAVHWSMIGAISALGPVAGGWVKDWFTAHPPNLTLITGTTVSWFQIIILTHDAIVWLVMFPLLLKISRKESEWPIPKGVAHIFFLAPLRAARNLYTFNPLLVKTKKDKSAP